MTQFFGKFRGKVENNRDPQSQGRVQVSVPAVLGDGRLPWAMPCVPYAGDQVGFFAIPPLGANVWVEFEGGNLDSPIYSGCFWGSGELPSDAIDPLVKIWKTEGLTLKLDDTPGSGGVTIEMAAGARVVLTSSGIEIDNGSGATIKLSANAVSVNGGALEVT